MTITDMAEARVDDADVTALLARAAAGDRDAFGSFYDQTAPRIYAMLLRVHDPRRSESLLEEIYVEAWERTTSRGVPPCPAWEWLALMARRHVSGRG
ncbi:MAG: hypothetical protein PIR02_02265 [Microbacterium enclense]